MLRPREVHVSEDTQPESAQSPGPGPDPATQGTSGPPDVAPEAAQPTKPSRRPAIIIVGVIVVFLAVVLFAVRNNASADELKVGDCLNLPNGSTFQTVEKQACAESHTAEVIFVGEYTGTTYPISLSLDSYIEEQCVPAFEAYVGRAIDSEPELSLGYFHPSHDGWDGGERTITCYLTQPDESPMTESVKAT